MPDTEPNSDADEGIRKRLQQVCDRHSQADVARVCATSRANVSRYLSGNRIPASLCAALVKGFGVNPAWLLNGEGSPYLADIHAGHARMATDLLEVVEAMHVVAQMRLGALTGKQHLKALRDLDDALRAYERLREKLNEHSRPILAKLLDDVESSFGRKHPERVHQLRRAAEQVARLCDDEDLAFRLLEAQAMDDMVAHRSDLAVDKQRSAALRAIVRAGTLSTDALAVIIRSTYLLEGAGRLDESVALCRAMRVLGDAYQAPIHLLARLDAQIGDVLTELGEIQEGMPLLQRAMTFIDDRVRPAWMGPWSYAQYFSGVAEFEHLAVQPRPVGGVELFAQCLARMALWSESGPNLQRALEIYRELRKDLSNDPEPEFTHATWALRALQQPTQSTLAEAAADIEALRRSYPSSPQMQFQISTFEAQLALLCGRPQEARKLLDAAAEMEQSLPKGVRPYLIGYAIQHHVALRAKGPQRDYDRAREWFVTHYRKGYGRFRPLASD